MRVILLVVVSILGSCGAPGEEPVSSSDTGDIDASEADAGSEPDVLGVDASRDAARPPRLDAHACWVDPTCGRMMVAAHRGFHHASPENSLAALRAAAALGVDFVECDVRHTSDDVLVLMHDTTVDRTTDGSGELATLSWSEVSALTLDSGDGADPESVRVPRLSDVLEAARQLGVMLYLDQKTDHTEQVIDLIAGGGYHDLAVVRDDSPIIVSMVARDPALEVLPAVASWAEFEEALTLLPDLRMVELTRPTADANLTERIGARGVRVQQDVIAAGDLLATTGDYRGWETFVVAGISLAQTDLPQLLLPALVILEETGSFPTEGPRPEP